MKRMLLALMWWSLAVAQAGVARAEPPRAQAAVEAEPENPEYKQAVDAAIEEYGRGHYAEARSLFERAHALDPNARTLRGLGMVEFELRHYVRAAELLEASRTSQRKPLPPDQRAAVDELLARTRQFIARYTVTVQPETPASQFELDGQPVELDAERRLTLETGEHVLRVSAPDRLPRELRIDAKGGEQRSVRVELPAKLEPGRAPAATTALQTKRSHDRPVLGITLISVGSAIAAAGASLGVIALLDAKDAKVRDSAEADRAHNFALSADVALGVGIATAVTGAVLLLLERKATSEERRSSLQFDSVFPAARVRF